MEPNFWIESWQEGGRKTSFHRPDIHPYILDHISPEMLAGKRVLVPLCGKSVDMLYFAEHAAHVTGIELSETAIQQFLMENSLRADQFGTTWYSGRLTLHCMDFFETTQAFLGPVDLLYDRAALVALPDPMRHRYVQHIHSLTAPGSTQFINTLEYAPCMGTPPFSVPPSEVLQHYGKHHEIIHLEYRDVPDHGLIRAWGLDYVKEHLFRLERQTHGVSPLT